MRGRSEQEEKLGRTVHVGYSEASGLTVTSNLIPQSYSAWVTHICIPTPSQCFAHIVHHHVCMYEKACSMNYIGSWIESSFSPSM